MDRLNRRLLIGMSHRQRRGLLMIVRMIWPGHGGVVVPGMCFMCFEVAVDFTIPILRIVALKFLARVTEQRLDLHFRGPC